MSGNHTNAYATVNPNKQNIGDAIDDVENQGFRYRAEQRIVEANNQKKKDDRERKLKEFNDNAPKFVPTGVETEDEYMYAGVQNAANQLYEVQKQFNELNNKTNLTPDEERKLYQLSAKRNNLQNYPDNLKRMMESQTNAAKDYLEGIKKGTYLNDPNIDKKLSTALTGYVPGIDESGMPAAGLFDKDGDGVADVLSFEDVNSQLFIQPVKRNDVYASVSELAKTFKADETKTEKGYWTTENKYVDEAQARATIKGMLDENAYKTEAHRRGLPLDYKFSDVEKQKFEDDLLLSLRNRVTESYTKTKDNVDENADNRLAFDKKKQAEELAFKNKKEENDAKNDKAKLALAKAKAFGGTAVDDTPLNIDGTKGNSIQKGTKKINDKVVVPDGSIGFALQGDGVKRVIGTGEKAIVEDADAVFYDPNSDRLIIRANRINGFKDGSTKEVNEEEVYYNSDENASDTWEFFQKRKDNNGNYYKNLPEVISKYKKIAGVKSQKPKVDY